MKTSQREAALEAVLQKLIQKYINNLDNPPIQYVISRVENGIPEHWVEAMELLDYPVGGELLVSNLLNGGSTEQEQAACVGTRVLTRRPALIAGDWMSNAHVTRKWGKHGTITDYSNAHGLCFKVEYDEGGSGWFETRELTVGAEKRCDHGRDLSKHCPVCPEGTLGAEANPPWTDPLTGKTYTKEQLSERLKAEEEPSHG